MVLNKVTFCMLPLSPLTCALCWQRHLGKSKLEQPSFPNLFYCSPSLKKIGKNVTWLKSIYAWCNNLLREVHLLKMFHLMMWFWQYFPNKGNVNRWCTWGLWIGIVWMSKLNVIWSLSEIFKAGWMANVVFKYSFQSASSQRRQVDFWVGFEWKLTSLSSRWCQTS